MRHLAQISDAQLRIGESILPIVVLDSGLVLRTPRNDDYSSPCTFGISCVGAI
jgi:hypothetical protein